MALFVANVGCTVLCQGLIFLGQKSGLHCRSIILRTSLFQKTFICRGIISYGEKKICAFLHIYGHGEKSIQYLRCDRKSNGTLHLNIQQNAEWKICKSFSRNFRIFFDLIVPSGREWEWRKRSGTKNIWKLYECFMSFLWQRVVWHCWDKNIKLQLHWLYK